MKPTRIHGPCTFLATLLLAAACGGGGTNGDCEVLPGTIDTHTTLQAGCYQARTDVFVNDSTLTLMPGVSIIFSQDTELHVSDDGALQATGTATAPIVLTGEQKMRGFWGGVVLTNANSVNNLLQHVTIEYAGSSEMTRNVRANLYLDSSGYPVRLSMNNCIIKDSGGYGMFIDGRAVLPDFSNNRLISNTIGAAYVDAPAVGQLADTSHYTGNDENVIMVDGDAINDEQTWQAIDVPYHIKNDIHVTGHLTIMPGATLQFAQDAGMQVYGDGALTAAGSMTKRILFTGQQPMRGYWAGLYVSDANSVDNRFAYVTVEYGGSYDRARGVRANVYLDSAGYPVRLSMTNCKLSQSGGYGLFANSMAVIPAFTSNQLTGNMDGAAYVDAEAVGQLNDSTHFTGNEVDRVVVDSDRVQHEQTWPAIDVPYHVLKDIHVTAHLSIAAGAILQFAQDAGMQIYDYGSLSAIGTTSKHIVFTGEQKMRGFWNGLYFSNTNSVDNILDYTQVEYGGAALHQGFKANVFLDSSGYPVRITVAHSSIDESAGWGIWLAIEAVVNSDINLSNTFTGNTDGTVFREPT